MATINAIGSQDPIQVAFGGTGLATITAHSVMVGEGTSAVTPITVGTNGQVIIGATGADPAFATITSSGGTITFTPGANTLNMEVTSPGGGFTWAVTTVNASMVASNGYIANKAGLLTMTLPASSSIGDVVAITGINNATGWKIAQNANQIIHFGTISTTTGATGFLASASTRDTVTMVCVVAGASAEWNVINSVGNISYN
jgi:hypothetical protein